MKKTLIVIGTPLVISAGAASAATPHCVDTGKKIEAELKTAKLTAADKATAEATFKKAQDECKANKQADAAKDFEAIQKMLKKS